NDHLTDVGRAGKLPVAALNVGLVEPFDVLQLRRAGVIPLKVQHVLVPGGFQLALQAHARHQVGDVLIAGPQLDVAVHAGVSGQDQIAVAVAKPHVAQDVPVVDQPEVGQRLGAVDGKPAFTLGVDGGVVLDPAEAVVGHPVQIDTRRPRAARNCDGPVELDYRAGLQRAVLPFGLLAREVAVDYDAVGLAVLARGRGYDVAVYVQRALGAEAHPNPLGQGRRRGLHRIQDLHVGRAPDRHFEGRRRGRARVFARSSRRSHP